MGSTSFTFWLTFYCKVWGVSIGAAILQNQLAKRLPTQILQTVLAGGKADSSNIDLAYSIIPVIRTFQEPLKHEVRAAFADSLTVIWQVMTGISGMGLLASLWMQDVPIHNQFDDKWDMDSHRRSAKGDAVDLKRTSDDPRPTVLDDMNSNVPRTDTSIV